MSRFTFDAESNELKAKIESLEQLPPKEYNNTTNDAMHDADTGNTLQANSVDDLFTAEELDELDLDPESINDFYTEDF